jgi:hypothetical protein
MEKKDFAWWSFFIIPIFLLIIHVYFFKTVDNHKYKIHIDPDYQYLVSSIDISNLKNSRMVLHPGTTVQIMSHIIMKTIYLFSSKSGDDFQTAVLKDPVSYLNILNSTFVLLNIILVLWLGLSVYNISKKIIVSLLIQFTPFLSSQTIIFGFRKITADIVMIFASLLMVLFLVKILYIDRYIFKKRVYIYLFFLGLISGFGIATKVPFVFLLIIPVIILPKYIHKIIYIVSTIVCGFLFTLPIAPIYYKTYKFYYKIFTHTGIYGRGEKRIVDLNDYILNLSKILVENLPFVLILIASMAYLIYIYFSTENRKATVRDISFRLLFSITIAQLLGIFVVAKHFKSKYLIPVLCLSGLLLYLIYSHFGKARNHLWDHYPASQKKKYLKGLYSGIVCFLIFSLLFTLIGVIKFHHRQADKLRASIAIQIRMENEFSNYGVIYHYYAPSVIFGLEFGNRWTPIYTKRLRELYGDQYFYNHFSQRFYIYNWHKRDKVSLQQIKKIYQKKVIMVGKAFHQFSKDLKIPPFSLRDVFGGGYFTIYKFEGSEK